MLCYNMLNNLTMNGLEQLKNHKDKHKKKEDRKENEIWDIKDYGDANNLAVG